MLIATFSLALGARAADEAEGPEGGRLEQCFVNHLVASAARRVAMKAACSKTGFPDDEVDGLAS